MENFASNLDEMQAGNQSVEIVWSENEELEITNNDWSQSDDTEAFNDYTEEY